MDRHNLPRIRRCMARLTLNLTVFLRIADSHSMKFEKNCNRYVRDNTNR